MTLFSARARRFLQLRLALPTLATLAMLLLGGCDCSGPETGLCESTSDCSGTQMCVDGRCIFAPDTGPDDAGSSESDAGSDAGRRCPSMVLCGSPAACCDMGQECIEGSCLAACESEVRCGAGLETCCGAGQVCVSDSCVDPGDSCADSFDCLQGAFCEPTLGRCLPQFDPVTCINEPVFGDFAAEVEWSVTSSDTLPTCMHGISAPVVVDLTGDGEPEVVANFACDSAWIDGVLRAFTGAGEELWVADNASLNINGRGGIAAADIDGDGRSEIIALTNSNRLIAIDDDGTFLWRGVLADGVSPSQVSALNGAPTIADLDGDGSPEIIVGATVHDATGMQLWSQNLGGNEGSNGGYMGGISAVADLDGDAVPEVIAGRRAYSAEGSLIWTGATAAGEPIADGYPAIAQFDDDSQPEVVLVASGQVYVLDGLTGVVQWGPVNLPGGGRGGPPTVADFDGDGEPEIGVAGSSAYTVFDPSGDADVLWSRETQDASSNATGSSVFDFEGDGIAEVVYGDECYMRVYRGSDGMVLLQIDSQSSTIHEYPLVADVDADGNSEILIVANDRSVGTAASCREQDEAWDGERRGIYLYGDTRDQWVGTRRVWNQHAYHVTNISTAGVVPAVEVDNWSAPGLNNYRQNVQGAGVFNAPDLKVLALEVLLNGCPETATLRARIVNEGNLGVVTGVPVAFRRGTPESPGELLGVVMTAVDLLPGATTVVELADVALTGDAPYNFVAFVDDDGTGVGIVTECEEGDNAAGIGDLTCDILF